MPDTRPCRLFVLMAREAPVAVVLRRAPSDWYHLLRWQTRSDVFTDGAWFRGRIYEEKCDVSPNGELLAYFCHQGRKLGTSYTDSWTAVSRVPWLHALALWPEGSTYGGGAYFVDDRTLAISTPPGFSAHPDHPPHGLKVVEFEARPEPPPEVEVAGADWAGHDQLGRIVFCRQGKIFRRRSGADVELIDLNDRTPDPTPAPDLARRPLPVDGGTP